MPAEFEWSNTLDGSRCRPGYPFPRAKLEARCARPKLRHPSRQNLIQSQLAGSDDSYIRALSKTESYFGRQSNKFATLLNEQVVSRSPRNWCRSLPRRRETMSVYGQQRLRGTASPELHRSLRSPICISIAVDTSQDILVSSNHVRRDWVIRSGPEVLQ